MPDESTKKLLYDACCNNNLATFRENLSASDINTSLDDQGNTALHLATRHGQQDIIRFLLRYHANREVLNNEGKTPEQMTSDNAVLKVYQTPVQPPPDATENQFATEELKFEPIEWLDSYRNAYRISCENHEQMERLITQISLKKLLETIDKEYIDKLDFSSEKTRTDIKQQLQYAIDEDDPMSLAMIYTGASKLFYRLNGDLAKQGFDFRFVSTRLDYPDNEPPKDFGPFIYASLLTYYTVFGNYRHASRTFRGTNITSQDLKAYETKKVLITCSFLSISKRRDVAELFMAFDDLINRPPVMCIYNISNPRSSLCTESFSNFPEEEEVLIVPFIAFEITAVREVTMTREGIQHLVKEIELTECGPNPK